MAKSPLERYQIRRQSCGPTCCGFTEGRPVLADDRRPHRRGGCGHHEGHDRRRGTQAVPASVPRSPSTMRRSEDVNKTRRLVLILVALLVVLAASRSF